jgi:hypothetical protein
MAVLTVISAFGVFPGAPFVIWIFPCLMSIVLYISVSLKIYEWRKDGEEGEPK